MPKGQDNYKFRSKLGHKELGYKYDFSLYMYFGGNLSKHGIERQLQRCQDNNVKNFFK